MNLSHFSALTFDCLGTLIDWPAGILAALRPLALKHALTWDDAALLDRYARLERDLESGPYITYRHVLHRLVRGLFGDRASDADADTLARALGTWHPFPDTIPSLQRLATRYRLAILSNVDDDLFAPILTTLRLPFDAIVTAQQVRSYKPAEAHFREGLRRLDLPASHVLHVGESRYHDVEPARRLGLATVWVNRGASASGASDARPDLEVRTLAELADLAGV